MNPNSSRFVDPHIHVHSLRFARAQMERTMSHALAHTSLQASARLDRATWACTTPVHRPTLATATAQAAPARAQHTFQLNRAMRVSCMVSNICCCRRNRNIFSINHDPCMSFHLFSFTFAQLMMARGRGWGRARQGKEPVRQDDWLLP